MYMFIPVQLTAISSFTKTMALLLQSKGYTCPLCDWSLDTWDLFQNITKFTPTGLILFNVPYFHTGKGVRINILIYNNSHITTAWDSIPGICIYSPGFTIISKKRLNKSKDYTVI